jgi:hypothetical protein
VPSQSVTTTQSLRDVTEIRAGLAAGGLFLTTAVIVSQHVHTGPAMVALFLQTGLSCLSLERRSAAFLVGLTGWALCTGFVVNQLGDLTFAGPDLARLAAWSVWVQTCCRPGPSQ